MSEHANSSPISRRFRGFLPVIVDVETGGLNSATDALLEVAAVTVRMDLSGMLVPHETHSCHVKPFKDANLDPKSLALNGIDPYHPLRIAQDEKDALDHVFRPIRKQVKAHDCKRAILVGHNAAFDLAFINAAANRCNIKRNPFHLFSTFDTVSLAGLAYGQTVLARAAVEAGLLWESEKAHSAVYDAEQTAKLFCTIVNSWETHVRAPAEVAAMNG